MTTITNEQAWREWHRTSPQEVQPGIARIPLTLHMDGLKAVNVYALTDGDGVTLVDGGLALDDAEEELVAGLASIGAGLRRHPPHPRHPLSPRPLHPGRSRAQQVRHDGVARRGRTGRF
ncbi:MAG: hypothetical protein V9G19_20660 [Tetrasphaera sp.]